MNDVDMGDVDGGLRGMRNELDDLICSSLSESLDALIYEGDSPHQLGILTRHDADSSREDSLFSLLFEMGVHARRERRGEHAVHMCVLSRDSLSVLKRELQDRGYAVAVFGRHMPSIAVPIEDVWSELSRERRYALVNDF